MISVLGWALALGCLGVFAYLILCEVQRDTEAAEHRTQVTSESDTGTVAWACTCGTGDVFAYAAGIDFALAEANLRADLHTSDPNATDPQGGSPL